MTYRVQRSRRSKPGIPDGALYVGRPTQWGNPAKIGEYFRNAEGRLVFVRDNFTAVQIFFDFCKKQLEENPEEFVAYLRPLVGRVLCCWCGPSDVCHADILIRLSRIIERSENNELSGTLINDLKANWPDLSGVILL